jgi:hypothetical protein
MSITTATTYDTAANPATTTAANPLLSKPPPLHQPSLLNLLPPLTILPLPLPLLSPNAKGQQPPYKQKVSSDFSRVSVGTTLDPGGAAS